MQQGDALKRGFDIAAGLVLLLLTLPVMLLLAAGSAVALRAWPFFVQDRVGLDGRRLRFVKIRTLPTTCPAYADKYALTQVRTPAFARALRALHLDELPQLALVVAGHMSLVGPRPEMPSLHSGLRRDAAAARTSVRPGCTGLWQISPAREGLISEAPEYDAFYLAHRSLALDLWVMVQTARKVIQGGRTVRLTDVPLWARRAQPVVHLPVVTSVSEDVLPVSALA